MVHNLGEAQALRVLHHAPPPPLSPEHRPAPFSFCLGIVCRGGRLAAASRQPPPSSSELATLVPARGAVELAPGRADLRVPHGALADYDLVSRRRGRPW